MKYSTFKTYYSKNSQQQSHFSLRESIQNIYIFQSGTSNMQSNSNYWTHPPSGPVEGTLEHRPQLAVDIEAFLMNSTSNRRQSNHRETLEANDGVWTWTFVCDGLFLISKCRHASVFPIKTWNIQYRVRPITPQVILGTLVFTESMRTSRRWHVEPPLPRMEGVGVGQGGVLTLLTSPPPSVGARRSQTYLVCWANPETLVKMFMSALRRNKKGP